MYCFIHLRVKLPTVSDTLYYLKLYPFVEHKKMFCFQTELHCFCLCSGSQKGFKINNLKLFMSWDLQNFQNNDLSIVVSITSQNFDVLAILILLAL